ncbi:DUF4123 domain-containing protein [Cupriavidus agavae]|uniref:Uncharacterized protein DUF4123 n=1 Tax=Cupriavidus agavae TaxID=1001822 RepID=A0A4Q7RSV8_9BURK|nr:DUF4123 domain-containing protein [Cupriavidus agavae]RZT36755.1 uncharacterized protein DUF4123 [Cupriavidus agavae]
MTMHLPPDTPDIFDIPAFPAVRFAVINAAQVSPKYWSDLPSQRIVPEAFRDQSELFPILVDLDELDETQRATVLHREAVCAETSDKPYQMALLDAPGTSTSVVTHLSRRMVVRQEKGQDDILRIHDPLVFRHLRWLLSTDQLDSLLGPIDTWHWREPGGIWHSHSRDADQPSIRPLRLTPVQWSSLLRMADLQLAIRTLARVDANHAYRIETARQLDRLLADAQSIKGLDDRQDHIVLALQALRFGRSIHQHPALVQRLAMACGGTTTYVSACADLDDTHLQAFASDLEPAQ